MATILVVTSPGTYFASLGAMADAFAHMVQAYQSSEGLRYYSAPHTTLMLASVDGGPVRFAGGRSMMSDGGYAHARDINLLYLPSFEVTDPDDLRDILTGKPICAFHEWIAGVAAAGVAIGACGAAVGHLAAAGLLDGLPAAIHPRLQRHLHDLFPAVRQASRGLAVSGATFTCATDADGPLLAARMLEYVLSPVVCGSLADRKSGSLSEYAIPGDFLVEQAKIWLHDHFAQHVRIADLAARMDVSHQTLIRRFRAAGEPAPQAYLQRVRLEASSSMLAETRRPVGEIAQLVGYVDVASFRRKFQAMFGVSPIAFRRKRRPARRIAFPS